MHLKFCIFPPHFGNPDSCGIAQILHIANIVINKTINSDNTGGGGEHARFDGWFKCKTKNRFDNVLRMIQVLTDYQ